MFRVWCIVGVESGVEWMENEVLDDSRMRWRVVSVMCE